MGRGRLTLLVTALAAGVALQQADRIFPLGEHTSDIPEGTSQDVVDACAEVESFERVVFGIKVHD